MAGALAVGLIALGGPIAVAMAAMPAPSPGAAAALECDQLAGPDAAQALALLPAPRIVNLHGSVAFVTMEPFATFLIGMGYPEQALRDPRDGGLSQSSFVSSKELAGALAWHYERDGLRPMLVGHSQGGMLAVRTLHELAGEFNDSVPVYDPVAGAAQTRTTIRDPYTHEERPVVGVEVAFAAAIATGTLPRLLLGQWSMIPRLRRIPDTTLEFTGFTIPWDPIAGNLGSADPYGGRAQCAVAVDDQPHRRADHRTPFRPAYDARMDRRLAPRRAARGLAGGRGRRRAQHRARGGPLVQHPPPLVPRRPAASAGARCELTCAAG
ncbi:MAG: hypothetical protein ABI593_09150 [Betaproteobacteria bacterium]